MSENGISMKARVRLASKRMPKSGTVESHRCVVSQPDYSVDFERSFLELILHDEIGYSRSASLAA